MCLFQGINHENVDYSMWSAEDMAWAAGFIDGEGTISFYRRGDRAHPEFFVKIQAVNTRLEPLQKLNLLFGGGVYLQRRDDPAKNAKAAYVWVASHQQAGKVIQALLPYLVVKRPQAELALQARNFIQAGRKLHRSAETIAELEILERQFRLVNRKGLQAWAI